MAYSGTSQKCDICEKTVYVVDQITADNRVYHRFCFRCNHCKGTLKLSNYSSFEGVLYCKPHYDQLFKMTGSLDRSFEGAQRSNKVDRSTNNENQASSRVLSMFVGTQDKCVLCKKTVYPIEKVAIDGNSYHKTCFRCIHGGCLISPSNFVAHEGKLYCRHHHSQLFKTKGDFSQLTRGKLEDVKLVPSENHVAAEDVKLVPSENHVAAEDVTLVPSESHISVEDVKLATSENHVVAEEDVKLGPSDSPIATNGVEESA